MDINPMDINPANLRWFYYLDILLDTEMDEDMIQRLRNCKGSIRKFPLVIPDVKHLNINEYFNTNVLEKIKALDLEQNSRVVDGKREDIRQPLENVSENRQQYSHYSSVSTIK